ncbi:hypothetical protein D3C84_964080 [compost metagenome]
MAFGNQACIEGRSGKVIRIVANIKSTKMSVAASLLLVKAQPLGSSGDALKLTRTAGRVNGKAATLFISGVGMAINGVGAEYIWVHLVWWCTKDGIENKSILASPGHA